MSTFAQISLGKLRFCSQQEANPYQQERTTSLRADLTYLTRVPCMLMYRVRVVPIRHLRCTSLLGLLTHQRSSLITDSAIISLPNLEDFQPRALLSDTYSGWFDCP
jgi:hypothetical protein